MSKDKNKPKKKRVWMPKKRADKFEDKRTKRIRTRLNKSKKDIEDN